MNELGGNGAGRQATVEAEHAKTTMDIEQLEARFREAGKHWAAGKHEKARDAFEDCVSCDQLGEEATAREVEEAKFVLVSWMQYGAFLLDTGDPAQAIVALRRGMRFRYFLGRGNGLLATCYSQLKDHEKAVTALQDALKRRPSPVSWVLLFGELRCLGRNEEAEQCLHRALDLDEDYDEAHYNLGCCALRAKDWTLAEFHLRRALASEPGYTAAHAQLGYVLMQRHRSCRGQRALGEAEKHLRLALASDGDHYWTRVYLGNLCWQKESLAEAEAHFRRATELMPDCYEPHLYYGEILCFGLRKTRLGEQHLRRALALNPDSRVVHFTYGKFLHSQHRNDEAETHFQVALSLGDERATQYLEDPVYGRD